MLFKVKSGRVKDCIKDVHGNWVTPNKGWLVETGDGQALNGCKRFPDDTWSVKDIKAYLDSENISYDGAADSELLDLCYTGVVK